MKMSGQLEQRRSMQFRRAHRPSLCRGLEEKYGLSPSLPSGSALRLRWKRSKWPRGPWPRGIKRWKASRERVRVRFDPSSRCPLASATVATSFAAQKSTRTRIVTARLRTHHKHRAQHMWRTARTLVRTARAAHCANSTRA